MKKTRFAALALTAAVLSASFAHAQDAAPGQARTAAASIAPSPISVQAPTPEIRVVRFANPPVNLITPATLTALNQVVKDLGRDDRVKVVVFASGVDGYFFNHFDMGAFPTFLGQVGDTGKPLWVELVTNLANAPFITIGSIRGRAQGGGDELALALDLRYASREKAVFGQPEVGIGLFPGGGAADHLAGLVGKDRALEVLLSADDYDAVTAERYGWVTRALPDAQLDGFVDKLARRLATFDKAALVAVKRHVNATAAPSQDDLLRSYGAFTKSVSSPGLQARMPIFMQVYQREGVEKVESNLGFYVGAGNQQLHDARK